MSSSMVKVSSTSYYLLDKSVPLESHEVLFLTLIFFRWSFASPVFSSKLRLVEFFLLKPRSLLTQANLVMLLSITYTSSIFREDASIKKRGQSASFYLGISSISVTDFDGFYLAIPDTMVAFDSIGASSMTSYNFIQQSKKIISFSRSASSCCFSCQDLDQQQPLKNFLPF